MAYRLFVGNLPMDIKEKEIDDLFYKYFQSSLPPFTSLSSDMEK
jgi:RNA recognition motif-containing protein